MRVTRAVQRRHSLEVTIDGRPFSAGEKYTILELGYAVYLCHDSEAADLEAWMHANGESIPADPADGRCELRSSGGMLITSDPILVALSIESWWHRNGRERSGRSVSIPVFDEALRIVENREILNDFNRKHQGSVPYLALRLASGSGAWVRCGAGA